jgi:ABC-2 type transport system permease protein
VSRVVGVRPLLRATLRQEGRSFAPWILVVTALSVTSILVFPSVFPTLASRQALATTIGANPALSLVFGAPGDLTTAEGFNTWRALALGGFLAALMAIFTVVRASRGQEDSGQAELLASGVMSRSTRLVVAVAMALIASVALGVVCALATWAAGSDPGPAWLLSATFTANGWMFAAVAAVAAQLGSEARTASGLAVAVAGSLFLVRDYLDSVEAAGWTTWLTPQGWMQRTAPSIDDDWWPLLPAVALTAVLLIVAFALQARRDFGQGALAPRPGPAHGAVRSVGALAWRLGRASLVAWTVAFTFLGVVFGSLASSVPDLLAEDSGVAQVLAAGATTPDQLVGEFLVTILSLLGIIAAVSGVQVMLRVRAEELDDRVEPLLAGAVARTRFYAAHVLRALAGPTLAMLVGGTVVALLAGDAGLGVTVGDVLLQAVVIVPAVWTVVGVSVAVVGARPRLMVAAWAGVLVSFALTLLGPTFGLDDWALGISPFWHVPHVTAADVDWSGLGWVSLFTAGFVAIGLAGFRHRDLAR